MSAKIKKTVTISESNAQLLEIGTQQLNKTLELIFYFKHFFKTGKSSSAMSLCEPSPPSFLISTRFLTSAILFFGYCFQYMLKINMSIAIVCMVNNTALNRLKASLALNTTLLNSSFVSSECGSTISHGKSIVSILVLNRC